MAEKKRKKVNFGKDWSKVDPSEGLRNLKISTENISNIPGMAPHWQGELEKRKKLIMNWKKRSFMFRAANLLSGKGRGKVNDTVTGGDIGKYNPSDKVNEFMEALNKNPTNYEARILLSANIIKCKKEIPLEGYRDILLQATVANMFGVFSIPGLQTAVSAQCLYLTKFREKCDKDLERVNEKLESFDIGNTTNTQENQKKVLLKLQSQIETNLMMISACLTQAEKGKDQAKYALASQFTLKELTAKSGEKIADDAKKQIQTKAITVVQALRYLFLLHPIAHEVADVYINVFPYDPIGYFLKGRIFMSDLTFTVEKLKAGVQDKTYKALIQDAFKETYHNFGLAINRISDGSPHPSDKSIVNEYAMAIHYFYNIANVILNIKIPRPWLREALTKVRVFLIRMKNKDNSSMRMLKLIEQIMDKEDIPYKSYSDVENDNDE